MDTEAFWRVLEAANKTDKPLDVAVVDHLLSLSAEEILVFEHHCSRLRGSTMPGKADAWRPGIRRGPEVARSGRVAEPGRCTTTRTTWSCRGRSSRRPARLWGRDQYKVTVPQASKLSTALSSPPRRGANKAATAPTTGPRGGFRAPSTAGGRVATRAQLSRGTS